MRLPSPNGSVRAKRSCGGGTCTCSCAQLVERKTPNRQRTTPTQLQTAEQSGGNCRCTVGRVIHSMQLPGSMHLEFHAAMAADCTAQCNTASGERVSIAMHIVVPGNCRPTIFVGQLFLWTTYFCGPSFFCSTTRWTTLPEGDNNHVVRWSVCRVGHSGRKRIPEI